MFDSIYTVQRFEHERSTNLEHCILYEKASMAAQSDALDNLVQECFLSCHLATLAKTKSPKTTANAHQRLKRQLRSLLWNFVRASRYDDDCFLQISLRNISYGKDPHTNPYGITRSDLSQIISRLKDCGYIQRHIGFCDRGTGFARSTRIRPSLSLLEDLKTLPKDLAEDYVAPQPVIIRKGMLATLDDASAAHLARMTSTVSQQNEMLRGHSITHPTARAGILFFMEKKKKKNKKQQQRCVKVTSKAVRAVYHADIPERLTYGRIHGGSWQQVPSVFRREILIDGETTVELDYSAQIPHIVAGIQGIALTADPYTLPLDIPFVSRETKREIVKAVVVVALNASDRKSLLRGVRGKIRKLPWETRSSLSLGSGLVLIS